MDTQLKRLRQEAQALKAVMSIGKNGITEGTITLLQRELEQKSLVKVKLLKGFIGRDQKEVAEELARFTKAKVIQMIGHTIILYKA